MVTLASVLPICPLLLASSHSADRIIFQIVGIAVFALVIVVGEKKRRVRRRRIHQALDRPLRTKGEPVTMARFAESLGLELGRFPHPVIKGRHRGVPVSIDLRMRRKSFTRIRARLPRSLKGKLRVIPQAGRKRGSIHRLTGDAEFDAAYLTICPSARTTEMLLTDSSRIWMKALGDVTVVVKKTLAEVQLPGIEKDLDRLRGALELAVALATIEV